MQWINQDNRSSKLRFSAINGFQNEEKKTETPNIYGKMKKPH